jgi:hypothetical protein
VSGKHLPLAPNFFLRLVFLVCLGTSWLALAEPEINSSVPRFLGSQSCGSSSCHGGAGDLNNQFIIWSHYDFHHERPVATLTTARSERLADVLKIGNPMQSSRCTVCHAPMQTVSSDRISKDVRISEGISCENCHGPAENWLRSHTRKDYTHADRVAAGMRDTKNPYVRANTCVACHQNVESDILRAGHPELIFELDGQSVTQPKHWRKDMDKPGAQLWLVGQAVALREMSWRLANEKSPGEDQINRWRGLLWILQRAEEALSDSDANLKLHILDQSPANAASVQKVSDSFARKLANHEWSDSQTSSLLKRLANTHGEFLSPLDVPIQARRAERLVLSLDRLTAKSPKDGKTDASLNQLFAAVQSLPDFDPAKFSVVLKEFHTRVTSATESK